MKMVMMIRMMLVMMMMMMMMMMTTGVLKSTGSVNMSLVVWVASGFFSMIGD